MEEEYRKRELEIKKRRVLEELKNNKFEFKELQQNITNPLQDILAFNQSVDKLNKTIQSTYKTNSELMQQIAENAQNALKQSIYKTNSELGLYFCCQFIIILPHTNSLIILYSY
ncbi:hypothetical protein P4311_27700 [Bacillus thuringiensis]|nr:hypothetical protein [Bacillus thuringiensis]MRB59908.1 hypothetical protein [Bacillus thuringiensis]